MIVPFAKIVDLTFLYGNSTNIWRGREIANV